MKFAYSRNFLPAAPILEVTFISAAESRRVGLLAAIVDSGADGTLVPLRYLAEIQAPSTSELFVRSHWGERRRAWLYLVDVQIGTLIFPGLEVVGYTAIHRREPRGRKAFGPRPGRRGP